MEVHVYVRMGLVGGGTYKQVYQGINIQLLEEGEEAKRAMLEKVSRFDAASAQCYTEDDRQLLLAVIETGFGTLKPFNKSLRSILIAAIQAPICADSLAAV